MNLFKTHLSFIFTLLLISFSFHFHYFIKELSKDYEQALNKDYSVVVVSKQEIQDLNHIKHFNSIQPLSTEEILNKLKKDISEKNLISLKAKLPNFYSIQFDKFMSQDEINQVKKQLLKIPNVLKVETFSKSHIKVYKLLKVVDFISLISLIFTSFLSIFVFIKQIKIWEYEHSNRIYILSIFGANFFQRASIMLKVIFVDNIICSALMFLFFMNFNNFEFVKNFLEYYEINTPYIDFSIFTAKVSLALLCLSLLCVIFVMQKIKKQG